MPKTTRDKLNIIKNFIDGTYSNFGNSLSVNTNKKYDPENPELGYCYKYTDPVSFGVTYVINCSKIGIDYTDFRVMMHEYGHIYLGHLDGIHEFLDNRIYQVFKNYRGEIIDNINKECGIDYADKLIERVIDDPALNHSLHNIAMDMEVNSSVLSKEDVEEMEMDITSILPKYEEEMLAFVKEHSDDPELKKQLQDQIDKMAKESKIKLIVPERYYLGKDENGNLIPFPNNLTYSEYLILIIKHLDQFVKMLASIQMGGNGDTSKISQNDIQNVLNGMRYLGNKSDAYKQGYQDAMDQLRQQLNQGQQGQGQSNNQQGGNQSNSAGNSESGNSTSGNNPGGNSNGNGAGQNGNQGPSTQQASSGGQGGQGQNQGQQNSGSSGSGNSGMSQQEQNDYNQGFQDALNDMANSANGNGQGGNGIQGLDNLMESMGMSNNGDGSNRTDSPWKGMRKDPNAENYKDHGTDSRKEADKKREEGLIRKSGGLGCGSEGGPDATRVVDKQVDEVDMALTEVMRDMKNRVVKVSTKKDVMKLHNRGVINKRLIVPAISRKVNIKNEPKIVYLIDISGSMDTRLVDRILKTIARNMKKLNSGLKYDIITWSTRLGEHIKDIDPKKGVPRISMGGGTSIASGIKYFKDNYDESAILIVISDFEDYLQEWHAVEETMNGYSIYGFNYGYNYYSKDCDTIPWKNMKIRKFNGN